MADPPNPGWSKMGLQRVLGFPKNVLGTHKCLFRVPKLPSIQNLPKLTCLGGGRVLISHSRKIWPDELTSFKNKRLFEKLFYFNNKIVIAARNYKFLSVNIPCCFIGTQQHDRQTDKGNFRGRLKIINYK